MNLFFRTRKYREPLGKMFEIRAHLPFAKIKSNIDTQSFSNSFKGGIGGCDKI